MKELFLVLSIIACIALMIPTAQATIIAKYDAGISTPPPDPTSVEGGSWTKTKQNINGLISAALLPTTYDLG